MLLEFCKTLDYNATSKAVISEDKFNSVMRSYLNENAIRTFGIIDPLKVVITNFKDDEEHVIERPNHTFKDIGSRDIILKKTIYIDRDDFRVKANSKYYRLKPGGSMRIKYAGIITYEDHILMTFWIEPSTK